MDAQFFYQFKQALFYGDKICFKDYMVLAQAISIDEVRIEAVNAWPKSKLIKDIQLFLGFANIYRQFIQSFSKITALLTLMLKITLITSAKTLLKATNNFIFLISKAKLAFL